jgi:hypothetical protein
MRCEDCLPLIEEYFDGEAQERVAAQMRLHLSSCATCAAALDALSFEQEIYARYDRELEVTPALWTRVSAEIARTPQPESPAEGRPFLSRLRESFTAALGALAIRPALASSLVLLVVGIAAGSLWLARRPQPEAPTETARNNPHTSIGISPSPLVKDTEGRLSAAPSAVNVTSSDVNAGGISPALTETTHEALREYVSEPRARVEQARPAAEVDVEKLLAASPAPQSNSQIVFIKADDHSTPVADPTVFVNAAGTSHGVVTTDARVLDSGEEALARHVEQTQMLLRSFKNARPADDDTVNVAYERKLSRKLLGENATLQLDAETRGDKDTKQVLDSIEPFLLDIANLRDRPSREEVRSIKERVRKNEIIAALQVY